MNKQYSDMDTCSMAGCDTLGFSAVIAISSEQYNLHEVPVHGIYLCIPHMVEQKVCVMCRKQQPTFDERDCLCEECKQLYYSYEMFHLSSDTVKQEIRQDLTDLLLDKAINNIPRQEIYLFAQDLLRDCIQLVLEHRTHDLDIMLDKHLGYLEGLQWED